MGTSFYFLGDYRKAIDVLEDIEYVEDESNRRNYQYILAMAYAKSGDMTNFRRCVEKFKLDPANYPRIGYELAFSAGEYREAIFFLEEIVKRHEEIYKKQINDDFISLSERVSSGNKYIKEDSLQKENRTIKVLFVISLFLLIIIIVFGIYSLKARRKVIETLHVQYSVLEKELDEERRSGLIERGGFNNRLKTCQLELNAVRVENEELKVRDVAVWNEIFTLMFEKKDINYIKGRFPGLSDNIAAVYRDPHVIFPVLEEVAKSVNPGLLAEFKEKICVKSNEGYEITVMSILRFSVASVAAFMGVDKDAVYSRRKRLKNKINRSGLDNADKFIKWLG